MKGTLLLALFMVVEFDFEKDTVLARHVYDCRRRKSMRLGFVDRAGTSDDRIWFRKIIYGKNQFYTAVNKPYPTGIIIAAM